MTYSIREAAVDDAEAVVGILNAVIEARIYTVFDERLTVAAERDYIAGFPRRGVFHVAVRESDRSIVGFQSMEPFANYTHAFDHVGVLGTYVDLDCRRQGVSKVLFAATFEAARRKGYEKIFTYVRADNPVALAAYRRQGFRVIGTAERHAKIDGRFIDEIIIERWL